MKIIKFCSVVLMASLFIRCSTGPDFEACIPYQAEEGAYWGYININGRQKIEPRFRRLPGLFYDGYALIETTDGSIDYIDRQGNEFERNYKDATDFKGGIAFAIKENEYPVMLNAKLEEIKTLEKVDEVYAPNEGLICFKNTRGKWGYMNLNGEVVISPVYDLAYNFSDGLALIARMENDTTNSGKEEKVLYGFIDKNGNEVIQPTSKFKNLSSFSEGLAAYSDGQEWGWGFIDKEGNKVIRAHQDWQEVTAFHKGVASVNIGGLWGTINKKGKMIINPKFDNALYFQNGLAPEEQEDKIGFVNRKGNWVIEPIFDDILFGFTRRKAIVEKDNFYILINRKGEESGNKEFHNLSFSQISSGRVRSDFFDTQIVIDTLISQMNTNSINEIGAQTTLEEVMKKYWLSDEALPKNSVSTSLNVMNIDIDGEVDCSVSISFNDNVSSAITRRVSSYYYYYDEVVGYRPNNAARVQTIRFVIDLQGRKAGKGEQLAKKFKSVFELNGFSPDDITSSSNYYAFKTTEDGLQASIDFRANRVEISVNF